MKKLYGVIFKELRLNKGYSIKEIADSEVSSATISKFEHGSAMIAIDKFFRILSNINVSPGEFLLYVEDRLEVPYSYSSVTKDFAVFQEKNNNIVKLQKAIAILDKQISEHPERTFLRIKIINLKAIVSQACPDYSNSITLRELQMVKHHLLNTKNWNEFELRIYCGVIHLFDIDTIEKLTYKLINPLSYRLITTDIKWMMSIAINNVIDAILPKNTASVSSIEKEFFEKLVNYLNDNPIPDRYTSEKGFIKFNIGIFQYLSGEKRIGEQNMSEVIDAFMLIDCSDYARNLIIEFEKITGNSYLKL